jgi:hypothetical protein
MGGTYDRALIVSSGSQYVASAVGTGSGGGVGACTLLGPEGPGLLLSGGGRCFLQALLVTMVVVAVGCCSYFENYTVDASIFEMTFRGRLLLMIF